MFGATLTLAESRRSFENRCRNGVQKVTKNVSHRDPKICKIELGDLRILCLMSFCRSSFLNDSTTIFMVFQVMAIPWRQQIHRKRHVEAISEKLEKMLPKITENWSPNGVQKWPKIIKNYVLGSPLHIGGSEMPSRHLPASILESFRDDSWNIFDRFLNLRGPAAVGVALK